MELCVTISAEANTFPNLVFKQLKVTLARLSVDVERLLLRINVMKVDNIQAALTALYARRFQRLNSCSVLCILSCLIHRMRTVILPVVQANGISVFLASLLDSRLDAIFTYRCFPGLAFWVSVEIRQRLINAAFVADHVNSP